MRIPTGLLTVTVFGVLTSVTAFGQPVISAHSGMIHYTEGKVQLAGQPIESKFGNFPELKEKAELRTEEGRAEVLLTPGVFLRMGENSAVRMLSTQLTDSRVEFESGSVLIEADDLLKHASVTIVYGDSTIQPRKNGLYRLDSEPAQLRVYRGEAAVETAGDLVLVKEGRLLSFDAPLAVEKFDSKATDALDRWSRRRAEYLSMANISAAKYANESGQIFRRSGWEWNPYFGMFTFVPFRSVFSPYGFRFWTPLDVYQVYAPRVYWSRQSPAHSDSNLGYRTVAPTSRGYSGTIAAAGNAASGRSSGAGGGGHAGVSRGSGSGGVRGR